MLETIKSMSLRTFIQTIVLFFVFFGRLNGDLYDDRMVFMFLLVLSAFGILLIGKLKIKTFEFLRWQGLFYILATLSILWSVSRETTIQYLIACLARCFLIVYVSLYMRELKDLILVSMVFAFACFFNQIYVLLSRGPTFIITLRELTANDSGWNSNALSAASAMSLFVLYFLRLVVPIISRRIKLLYGLFVALDLFMCVICGSKSGVLTVVILLMGYFLFVHKRNRFIWFVLILLSIPAVYYALIKIPFFYNFLGKRVESLVLAFFGLQTLDNSDASRQNLVRLGIRWFKESPWIGKGMWSFSYLYVKQGGYRAIFSHNNYVEILEGLGIVGFVAYFYEYIKIIWNARKMENIYFKGFVIILMLSFFILDYSSVSFMVEYKLFTLAMAIFLVSHNPSTRVSSGSIK